MKRITKPQSLREIHLKLLNNFWALTHYIVEINKHQGDGKVLRRKVIFKMGPWVPQSLYHRHYLAKSSFWDVSLHVCWYCCWWVSQNGPIMTAPWSLYLVSWSLGSVSEGLLSVPLLLLLTPLIHTLHLGSESDGRELTWWLSAAFFFFFFNKIF